jgi:glycine betaine/proline transport system ATP-binding protein
MTIPARTVLEEAAKMMTDAGQYAATVTGPDGRPIGSLDLYAIVAAMVTPVGHDAGRAPTPLQVAAAD